VKRTIVFDTGALIAGDRNDPKTALSYAPRETNERRFSSRLVVSPKRGGMAHLERISHAS